VKRLICVRIPATTANVGPGFDTLGIALQLYNRVGIKLTRAPRTVVSGEFEREESHAAMKMVMQAARAFFHRTEREEAGMSIHIEGDIPISRGLGSSATVRLGIVAGLNRLYGGALKAGDVLDLVAGLEGHPDNASAAIHGGLVVAGDMEGKIVCIATRLPKSLRFVAAIPDYQVETKKARALLPASLPLPDAVHNLNRTALLVASFWNRDYKAISNFLDDRIHQPYRAALVPQLFPAINAARLAGAIGGWLSGSGSTIMAMTLTNPEKVGQAMQKVFDDSGKSCRIRVLGADHHGLAFEPGGY